MMVGKIRCFCQSKSIHNCVIASSLEWVGRPENRFLSSIQLDSEKLKTRNSFLSQISKLAWSAIQLETLQYSCIPCYDFRPLFHELDFVFFLLNREHQFSANTFTYVNVSDQSSIFIQEIKMLILKCFRRCAAYLTMRSKHAHRLPQGKLVTTTSTNVFIFLEPVAKAGPILIGTRKFRSCRSSICRIRLNTRLWYQ